MSRKLRALGLCVGLTVGLVLLLQVSAWIEAVTLADLSSRGQALGKIGGAVLAEALLLVVVWVTLRGREVAAFENPAWEAGRRRGWILAAVVWGLWVLPMMLRPPAGVPIFEASWFNAVGSLTAGVGAGIAEEWIFRGLVFALMARGGWGTWAQLLASSLLFGLAHVGWGLFAGNPAAFVVPVVGTSVLGLLFGAVYLLAGRRLLPAVALHVGMDLVIEPWLILASIEGTLMMPGS